MLCGGFEGSFFVRLKSMFQWHFLVMSGADIHPKAECKTNVRRERCDQTVMLYPSIYF